MTAIITSPLFLQHCSPSTHPECKERITAICEALKEAKLFEQYLIPPRYASEEELMLCHNQPYIDLVKKEAAELHARPAFLSTGDVLINQHSFDIARLAAGAVLTACDAVMEKRAQNAFCVVRPPGHHACTSRGMGFCIFNNVAIGARYVQKRYGIERVLIVDFDVHHGNGTQEIFNNDPSVFYFSTHDKDNYPGTGHEHERGLGQAIGTKMNVPFSNGPHARDTIYNAFTTLATAMKAFSPQFVFISAGFDAHKEDPLGRSCLTEEDFFALTKAIRDIAHTYAQDRLVSVLEGGYNLSALARSAVQHVRALQG